jgi:hypothetical protein
VVVKVELVKLIDKTGNLNYKMKSLSYQLIFWFLCSELVLCANISDETDPLRNRNGYDVIIDRRITRTTTKTDNTKKQTPQSSSYRRGKDRKRRLVKKPFEGISANNSNLFVRSYNDNDTDDDYDSYSDDDNVGKGKYYHHNIETNDDTYYYGKGKGGGGSKKGTGKGKGLGGKRMGKGRSSKGKGKGDDGKGKGKGDEGKGKGNNGMLLNVKEVRMGINLGDEKKYCRLTNFVFVFVLRNY